MGLLRILGILLIIYFAMRLISRFLLPFIGRYFVKKANESMQERMRQQREGDKIYQDGEVTIRKANKSGNKSSEGDDGEYVDYEEV